MAEPRSRWWSTALNERASVGKREGRMLQRHIGGSVWFGSSTLCYILAFLAEEPSISPKSVSVPQTSSCRAIGREVKRRARKSPWAAYSVIRPSLLTHFTEPSANTGSVQCDQFPSLPCLALTYRMVMVYKASAAEGQTPTLGIPGLRLHLL